MSAQNNLPEYEEEPPLPEADDEDALLIDEEDEDEDDEQDYTEPRFTVYRGSSSDPTFGYLISMALAFGTIALPPDQRDLRFTLLWALIAGFGVLAWLLGSRMARIGQETPENLAWGIVFGLIIATPFLAVGASTLAITVNLLFFGMSSGALLAYLVFVMPLAETLFFRGLLQEYYGFWLVAVMSSLWGAVFFLPLLNISSYPAVVIILALGLFMINVIYSYVRRRNGLAAAWLCQIVVNLVLLFIPYISS
jgi:membrane protease YdiL (CAAX protease family)